MTAIIETPPAPAAPFNLKKVQPQGQCAAMRCKNACTDLLCDKHLAVWRDAGSPSLAKDGAKALAKTPSGPMDASQIALLEAYRVAGTQALHLAQSMPLTTEAEVEVSISAMNKAKGVSKDLDEKRKSLTAPLNAVVKEINRSYNETIDVFDAIAKTIQTRNSDRLIMLEKERRAALALVAANPAAAPAEAYAAATASTELPSNAGAMRARYSVRLVDANLVPEALPDGTPLWKKVLDYDALQAYARAAEARQLDPAPIPGIEIVKDYSIAKGRES